MLKRYRPIFLSFIIGIAFVVVFSPEVNADVTPSEVDLYGNVYEEVLQQPQVNKTAENRWLATLILPWLDVAVAEATSKRLSGTSTQRPSGPSEESLDGGSPGNSIEGVYVRIAGGPLTITDGNGFYQFRLSRNRTYTLTFSKSGYELGTFIVYLTKNKRLDVFLNPTTPGGAVPIISPAAGTNFRSSARNPLAIPITATDTNSADIVTISVTNLPSWASVDNRNNAHNPATVYITGTPPVSAIGEDAAIPPYSFTVTATDGANPSPPSTFNLYVTRFKDASASSGIFTGPGGDTADTRTVDFADIDGDGDLDILTATFGFHHVGKDPEDQSITIQENEYNRLYHNNGDGTFTDISDNLGLDTTTDPPRKFRSASAGFIWHTATSPSDPNLTLPDIMIHSTGSPSWGSVYQLLQNDGAGIFHNLPPIQGWSRGNEDVVSFYSNAADKNSKANWATILMNAGSPAMSAYSQILDRNMVERTDLFPATGYVPPECISEAGDIVAGNMDNDGDQDLFLGGLAIYDSNGQFFWTSECYNGETITHSSKERKKESMLFRNAGADSGEVGNLENVTTANLPSFAWPASVDPVANPPTAYNIFYYERHADFGDLNGDGDLDLFIADPAPGTTYGDAPLINNGSGNFQFLPGLINWAVYRDTDVKIGDIDHDPDGMAEVVLLPFKGQIKVLKMSGSLNLNTDWTFPKNPSEDINNALKLGDLDNDGDLDLYVAKDGEDLLYFNMTCTQDEPCLPENDAVFISQSVPSSMTGGFQYEVSLTFQNRGSADWTSLGGYRLGSQNPEDNTTWGFNRVELETFDAVATGQDKTFTFTVTAPSTVGTYDFQWKMVQEGVEWFGELSHPVSVSVTVNNPPEADDQSVELPENSEIEITLTGSDVDDPNGDHLLIFSIDTGPSHGTLGQISQVDNTSASVTYSPETYYNGPDTFTFKVTDEVGSESASATVSIDVIAVNSPPVANAGPDQTVTVNDANNNPVLVALDGSGSYDPDGDALTYQWREGTVILSNSYWVHYTFPVGSHLVTLEVSDGFLTDSDDVLVTVEGYPEFTEPAETSHRFYPGNAFSITFTAVDGNLGLDPGTADDDQVTLSVIGDLPDWLNPFTGASGNPVSYTFTSKPGRPNINDAGVYTFTVRATDDSSGMLFVDKPVVLYSHLFEEVTTENLPADINRTPSADAEDIDGDGDPDLVIAHLPSSQGTTTPGTRILINDGSGVFTDDTSGRLKDFDGSNHTYYSHGVRFGRQHPLQPIDPDTNPLNLFLSDWRRVYDSYEGYPCDWAEEALAYRLVNDESGSGTFSPQRYVDWAAEFITRGKMDKQTCYNAVSDPDIDGSLASDIEVGYHDSLFESLFGFFGNVAVSDIPRSPNLPVAYHNDSEVFVWYDNLTYSEYLTQGNYTFLDIDGNPIPIPPTGDFELSDVDGDGDLDLLTAGVAFYGHSVIASGDTPYPSYLGYPPRLWLNQPFSQFRQFDITFFTWALPKPMPIEHAEFKDLNDDGKEDLVIVDVVYGLHIFRNTRAGNGPHGNVSFTLDPNPEGVTGPSEQHNDTKEVVIGDIDNDGKPDMILIGKGERNEKVFLNTTASGGTITFTEATDDTLPGIMDDSDGGRLFDMDGDGDQDLLIYNNGQDTLYENKTIP